MGIYEKIKIDIYRLIAGGMLRQLAFLFIFFVLVFISLTFILNMDSSRLFHNMTSFDYPPKDNHLLLQLLYLTGVVFFSGFLVMVLTNSVRNKIDLFKSGDIRLRLKNKISILGFNDLALGIIEYWIKRSKDINIEIIVEDGVVKTKEKIDGVFGKDNNIYVFHGGRNSSKELNTYHLEEALAIYIIGENEENSDFKNLECYSALCKLRDFANWDSKINLFLNEQASFTLISNRSTSVSKGILDMNHRLKVLNSDENWARKILIDIDKSWVDRSLYMRDYKYPITKSDNYVHLVIFGMTDAGEIIAKTAALSCHFPNFISKGIKSKITVIDNDFTKHRGILGGRYSDFMNMCHYSFRRIKDGTSMTISSHVPDNELDLLDIEWEFIESASDDALLQNKLVEWCNSRNEILTTVICNSNDAVNINIAMGLPRVFFDNNIPIWLHVKTEYSLSAFLIDSRYNNIIPWGMLDKFPEPNKWIDSTAKLLNYFFSTMDYETCRNDKYTNENQQLYEEIDHYWNSLSIEFRINLENETLGIPSIIRCMRKEAEIENVQLRDQEATLLYGIGMDVYKRLEHIRWLTAVLLRGFRPLTSEIKKEYEAAGRNTSIKRELRQHFYHPDIDSYEKLSPHMVKIYEAIVEFYFYLANKDGKKRNYGQHQDN